MKTTSSKVCETCGSAIDLEVASGLCAGCLLETALHSTAEVLSIGIQIGDFELLDEIARGGMGIVYRARQHFPSRIVALKMILPSHGTSPAAIARFRAEAEAAAALDHEGILPIYAVGEGNGAPFYSMKFAEGGSLSARLAEFQDQPREAAKLVAAIAHAVEHAHQRGILHRDLKPGNVLFDGAKKPFVSDFGLAKWLTRETELTQTHSILGTPHYMAPEQAAGEHSLNAAADIYSLGAILFHLLTARPPFPGDNAMEVLHQAAERPPPRLRALNRRIPRDLETICLKCLEKNPASRYGSAGALADDLERFDQGRSIRARRLSPGGQLLRWTRRNPVIAGLALASVCLLALLLLLTRRSPAHSEAQPTVAVLPFDNVDPDGAGASLADNIHDDVLVDLAKFSGLKVISRDSVMQYRGTARDLREIGGALGANAVLEGKIRRAGDRARVNVQLTNVSDGSQIWAENFERPIADEFGMESEVALQIASALKASVSAAETARVRNVPTKNAEAYRYFVEARSMYADYRKARPDLDKAEHLYEKAIALDPKFALAYAHLAQLENVYFEMYDHTPARREKSRAAAREALRLQPELPDAHIALGQDYWRAGVETGEIDYEKALAEFALAQRSLPNDPDIYGSIGRIQRHQGKWAKSTENLKKAAALDPNTLERWHRLFFNYELTHRYPEAAEALDRVIALAPPSSRWRYLLHRAHLRLYWKGTLDDMAQLPAPPPDDTDGAHTDQMAWLAIDLREFAKAERIVVSDPREVFSWGESAGAPKSFVLAQIYALMDDKVRAVAAYETALPKLEAAVRAHPRDTSQRMDLAETYARLNRKEDALREARTAAEIIPESKDAWLGIEVQDGLARIYFLIGDIDAALPIIKHSLETPGGFYRNELRIDPFWDGPRRDSRFQQILAEAPER